jgi:O-antigen/teichoic acid export membrane protein
MTAIDVAGVPAVAAPAPAPSSPRRLTREGGLTVNALSLATATVLTNMLGLAFWALASHLHAPAAVGRASAAVSALILLATVAQLNLPNVFLRFVPAAGARAQRFVARSYLVVMGLALVVGLVYVVSGLGAAVLTGGLPEQAMFVGSVALCAIFALQDGALTALRLAWWVPIENTSFAVTKLLLLPALVFLPAGLGIVVAWMTPVAIAVIVVNWLLFRRVLPAMSAAGPGYLPPRGRLVSFVAAEYSATLCSTAAMQAMPLLVLERLGPVENAYFTLPWLIWMATMVLLGNVMATFVAEMVAAGRIREGLRRGVVLWAGMVLTILVCCTLGAPLLLRVAGPAYVEHGADLLRLIGLSAPFAAVTFVYTGFAWLEQRVWRLAAIQAVTGTLLVGLTLVLLPRVGLVAVGWANLIAQALAAAAMAPWLWSRIAALRRAETTS